MENGDLNYLGWEQVQVSRGVSEEDHGLACNAGLAASAAAGGGGVGHDGGELREVADVAEGEDVVVHHRVL